MTYNTNSMVQRIVARFYQEFQVNKSKNTWYVKKKWEKETGTLIDDEEWDSIYKMQRKTTCSPNWREFGWKNVICFFITPPPKKKHQNIGISCWRLSGNSDATHYHLFWTCPKVTQFWLEVHKCLEKVLCTRIPFDFLHLYLGS